MRPLSYFFIGSVFQPIPIDVNKSLTFEVSNKKLGAKYSLVQKLLSL